MPLKYEKKQLKLGKAPLIDLQNQVEEPVYVYDLDGICQEAKNYDKSFGGRVKIHYAVKANAHPQVLQLLAKEGYGADVVSAGEVKAALDAGFKAEDIIFSGVGKTRSEIEYALQKGVGQINVESTQEMERIGEICRNLHTKANIAWRMNPDVNPQTHPYISTGFRENKFGMDQSFLPELEKLATRYKDQIQVQGLTIHIGSQITKKGPFIEAMDKTLNLYNDLQKKGLELGSLDIGGGVGIDYETGTVSQELLDDYGKGVLEGLKGFDGDVLCEPGRILTAVHGVLLAEVQYVKKTPYRKFAIVNTGMHHLMRPALYQASHRILPLVEKDGESEVYDVVGPICESSDVLGKDRSFTHLEQGDILVIGETGAYGMSMASRYNLHDLPEEKIWQDGEWKN